MRTSPWTPTLSAIAALLFVAPAGASGLLGIYGIITRAVIEPAAGAPERIQVWGAFAYVESTGGMTTTVSEARRGYLYFRLPSLTPGVADQATIDAVKREWADLQALAGTGQAVAFGSWGYIGGFGSLSPDASRTSPPYILERRPYGGAQTDLRVRPEGEPPANPAAYQTTIGIVKLAAQGSHADIVRRLRQALGGSNDARRPAAR